MGWKKQCGYIEDKDLSRPQGCIGGEEEGTI